MHFILSPVIRRLAAEGHHRSERGAESDTRSGEKKKKIAAANVC